MYYSPGQMNMTPYQQYMGGWMNMMAQMAPMMQAAAAQPASSGPTILPTINPATGTIPSEGAAILPIINPVTGKPMETSPIVGADNKTIRVSDSFSGDKNRYGVYNDRPDEYALRDQGIRYSAPGQRAAPKNKYPMLVRDNGIMHGGGQQPYYNLQGTKYNANPVDPFNPRYAG